GSERQPDGSSRWKPETRATSNCGKRAGSCWPIGSHWVSDDGTDGGKTVQIAIRAGGSRSYSERHRIGAFAATRNHHVQGCSPTQYKVAGSTSRGRNGDTKRYAPHGATSCGDSRRSCVNGRRTSLRRRFTGRTPRRPARSRPLPHEKTFVKPRSSSWFDAC